jgi:hypothetical protein
MVAALFAFPAKADDRIALRLEMYGLAGAHVLTLHSYLDENGNRYAINADYATTGVAGLMVDLSTRTQVHGLLAGVAAMPESFRSDIKRNGSERRERIDYYPNSVVKGSSEPPLPVPVTSEMAHGTVDDLTAYFMLERQLARTGKCNLAVPVFDGRHRFDLYFTDAGQQQLSPSSSQQFSGSTIACHMMRQMRMPPGDPEISEGAHQGTLWYAKLLPGDAMVPVRMKLETHLGTIDGYLAEVHGRGVNLKFME